MSCDYLDVGILPTLILLDRNATWNNVGVSALPYTSSLNSRENLFRSRRRVPESSIILSPKRPSNFSSYSKILEYFNSVVGAFIRENVRDLIDRYSLHCSRSTFHWCVLVAGFRRWRSKTEDARVLLVLPKLRCHTEKWCTKYAAILHPRGKIKRHLDRF